MRILILLLLTGCVSQERDVEQLCELKCTDCKYVELKCDTNNKTDDKRLGN